MKKLLTILTTLSLAFMIAGCNKKATSIPSDANYDYFDNDKEVSNIKLTNVPKQIQIGYLRQANIVLEISYADGTKDKKLLNESFFPKNLYGELQKEGNKYFDFVYKNKHIPLKFKLVKANVPMTYKVDFVNEKGNVIETKYVKYLQSVKCSKEETINDYFDGGYFYKFSGTFDHDLDYIYDNFTATPVFEKYKASNFDDKYYQNSSTYDVIDTIDPTGDGSYHTLAYIGRVDDFVVCPLYYTYIRDKYEDINVKYTKEIDLHSFYTNISKKVKDYVHRCYNHGTTTKLSTNLSISNTELLDFDLSTESDYIFNELSVNLPDCIIGDLSLTDYDLTPKQRKDGTDYSFYSLFAKEGAKLHETEYDMSNPTVEFELTEDYDKGYYDMNFILDLDLYLDIEYKVVKNGERYEIKLLNVKIATTFISGTGKFEMNYNTINKFEYYGNKFSIDNYTLALTLLEEVKKLES